MLSLLIEYDGTDYAGWQNQPNGVAVQQVLEGAVAGVFGVRVPVVGSGRTDAGVHARGQVAHVDLPAEANNIPPEKIAIALNTQLPQDIRIRTACLLEAPFHARFDAVWREYEYHISREKSVFTRRFAWCPDLPYHEELLADAAAVFVGEHDFTTFSKLNEDTGSYTCNVICCEVELTQNRSLTPSGFGMMHQGAPSREEQMIVRIRANRFVYGMCRSIVGAIMSVARGRCTPEQVADALIHRDRSMQEALAPPHGLVLARVEYNRPIFGENQE
jgi:tRNA pseudouridine38-40 synthase